MPGRQEPQFITLFSTGSHRILSRKQIDHKYTKAGRASIIKSHWRSTFLQLLGLRPYAMLLTHEMLTWQACPGHTSSPLSHSICSGLYCGCFPTFLSSLLLTHLVPPSHPLPVCGSASLPSVLMTHSSYHAAPGESPKVGVPVLFPWPPGDLHSSRCSPLPADG
jgi:hypothetical protein